MLASEFSISFCLQILLGRANYSTLMLLQRILHGKSLFTVTTLKQLIRFTVLLKSMIVDKESIAKGRKQCSVCCFMKNASPNERLQEKQCGIYRKYLVIPWQTMATAVFCFCDPVVGDSFSSARASSLPSPEYLRQTKMNKTSLKQPKVRPEPPPPSLQMQQVHISCFFDGSFILNSNVAI